MTINNKDYELAWLIREFENELLNQFTLGNLHGTVHTCIGQEFSAISVLKNFIKGDCVISNHRGHGHFLSVTKDFDGLMAEVMGREAGVCKGVGGSQHLYIDGFFSNGVQGGMAPIATGIALSKKLDNKDSIVFNFFGDGTLGEGSLYEALNISSKWEAPVLWVLENNGYAQSTNTETTISGSPMDRAQAFGIKYFYADIWDIEKLFIIAKEASNYVRDSRKPAFLEIKSYRLMAHSKGDDNRDKDEILMYASKDPLNIYLSKNTELKSRLLELRLIIDKAVKMGLSSDFCNYKPKSNNKLKATNDYQINLEDVRISEQIFRGLKISFNENKKLMMIGEDIEGPYGGAFNVTRNLSQDFPGRVLNTPIAENAIVGVATGLTLMGRQCIVEIMFGDFMTLTLDQLLQHACKFHDMYAKRVKVPLIVRTPMGGRRGYGPSHSQSIEKHFLGIYGLSVVALNHRIDNENFYAFLISNIESPHIVLENKILYTMNGNKKFPEAFSLNILGGHYPTLLISPPGDADITILCYGGMLDIVEDVIEELLFEDEILVEIICPTLLSEIETEIYIASLKKSSKLLAVEEGDPYAGFSAQVISELHEDKFNDFSASIVGYSGIIPACAPCEDNLLISKNDIIRKVKEMVNE